jgi:putative restriction endonuclease
VNFWQPSGGREFRILEPGEPFFFKTHYPHNKAVGGGFFSDSARLRVSEAWDFFGEANGAATVGEMRARIGRYRRTPIGPGGDPVIGCLFVRDVRFFPEEASVEPPPRFAPNIVQGKSYDLADSSIAPYFAELLQLTLGSAVELDFSQPWHRPGPVFGDPRLAPYRLGQSSFKAVVLDAYHRRCAISGTHIPPLLQAAHIRPVAAGGSTGSTMDCCCAPTSTRCLTAGIWASTEVPPAGQHPPAGGLQQRRPVLRQGRPGHRAPRAPRRPAQPRVP